MKPTSSFVGITSEGGLLPTDFLSELLAPKSAIEGLSPQSYSLTEGERVSEQVNRSWVRLKGRWADFKKAIGGKQPGDPTTTETRDRWLHPIFQELGFGQRLAIAPPIEVDGRSYPVSHGWTHVPIHLVGSHVDIDRRTPGAVGAAKASPHSLVQQALNASQRHLWGIVTNGLTFRLLRDSIALTRLSYVEWDLAAIFDGDLYSEFFLLWLVCHQSRFEGERAEQCWLEKWKKSAEDKGLRALQELRPGVARAIEALGAGLVSHPANKALCARLRSRDLSTQDFYRQVLRVIYRMLFLFVAEDRDLLHPPLPGANASKEENEQANRARRRYRDYYAITRLRGLTLHRAGTPHPDLWFIFQLLTQKLGSETGCHELALPALGSFLWDAARSTPDLAGTLVSNRHLLTAVHALAFVQDGSVRRPIDYKNLGSEELGSVYEGLLELHPLINADAGVFELNIAVGNERRTSGSYYTPDSLVQCLLDSALEPVMAEAVRGKQGQDAATALLKLKVCDSAVGSGHFLIGAAHRLARRVAAARSGEDEPNPEATRTALRDVIGRCLYGVDINPMSAELCRVSLWLEALEPGKPLSFLDHHIRVGNSLIGATPELIRGGLPEAAYDPIEGDDKAACTALTKQNKRENPKLGEMFIADEAVIRDKLYKAATAIDDIGDSKPEDIHRKEAAFQAAQSNYDFQKAKDLADLWCAAFVIKKHLPGGASEISNLQSPVASPGVPTETQTGLFGGTEETPKAKSRKPSTLNSQLSTNAWGITTQHLRDFVAGGALPDGLLAEAKRLADQHKFFHWHLAFPEVFEQGGFDLTLGNPPWGGVISERQSVFCKFRYRRAIVRMTDSFIYFCRLMCEAIRPCGRFGVVLPDGVLYQTDSELLRKAFLEDGEMTLVVNAGSVFEGVTRPAALLAGALSKQNALANCSDWTRGPNIAWFQVTQAQLANYPGTVFAATSPEAYSILEKILSQPHITLEQAIDGDGIQRGVSPDLKDAFVLDEKKAAEFRIEVSHLKPVLTGGRDIKRFSATSSMDRLIYTTRDDHFDHLPGIRSYIDTFKHRITCVEVSQGKHPIYALHRPRDIAIFLKPEKIVGVITEDEIIVAVDCQQRFATDAVYLFAPTGDFNVHFLAGLLNSKLFSFLYGLYSPEQGRVFAQVKPTVLKSLPIPKLHGAISGLSFEISRIARNLHESQVVAPSDMRALDGLVYQMFSLNQRERDFIEQSVPYHY